MATCFSLAAVKACRAWQQCRTAQANSAAAVLGALGPEVRNACWPMVSESCSETRWLAVESAASSTQASHRGGSVRTSRVAVASTASGGSQLLAGRLYEACMLSLMLMRSDQHHTRH